MKLKKEDPTTEDTRGTNAAEQVTATNKEIPLIRLTEVDHDGSEGGSHLKAGTDESLGLSPICAKKTHSRRPSGFLQLTSMLHSFDKIAEQIPESKR